MRIIIRIYYALQKIAKRAGYDILVRRIPKRDARYEQILPNATYAPWLHDEEFRAVYAQVQNYTLVDQYRCYELWQLVAEVASLPSGALIEVGAWRGGSGALLAKKAMLCGLGEKVYICDTFTGVVKAGAKDSTYRGGEHADTSVAIAQEALQAVGADNGVVLKGMFPEETASQVTDSTFRLCHIDVDVYQSAKDTLEWVWPKLVAGGVVVFDDYGFRSCDGVTSLVDAERGKDDRVVLHNLNGHAVIIKRH